MLHQKDGPVLVRCSFTMTAIAFATFVLTPLAASSCAEGSTRTHVGSHSDGGEGGEWGGQTSSSSSSGGGAGGAGGSTGASSSSSSASSSSSSASSSSSSASSSSSSSSSGGGSTPLAFVVLRVGNGIDPLSSAATRVYIEHRQTDGTLTPGKTDVELPPYASGNNWPLTLSGTAGTEGNLSLSSNGKYVFVAGYGAEVGTLAVNSTDASIYPRVVGRIDAQGNVDTTTTLDTAFSGYSVRGATSTDGISMIWVSGNGSAATGGVHHTTLGANTTTQILSLPYNARFVHVVSDQLYGTSGSGDFVNVFTIGTGLPTMPGQTATPLPNVSASSPYSFALIDRLPGGAKVDTLYVADDGTIYGGIHRWIYDGFSWTDDGDILGGAHKARGLAAAKEGNGVRIVATTDQSSMNHVLSIYDEPGSSPVVEIIATSSANTVYRGVAFAPQ